MIARRCACVLTVVVVGCGPMNGVDGGAGGGTGGTGPVVGWGTVTMSQVSIDAGVLVLETFGGSASFTTFTLKPGSDPAPYRRPADVARGACVSLSGGLAADAGVLPPDVLTSGLVSAGTLSVSGLNGGRTRTFMEVGQNVYSASSSEKDLAGGETLTVTATGAAVPAFSRTFTGPTPIVLTSPSCSVGGCGALSRAGALTVTWTGGGASDDVRFTFTSLGAGSLGLVSCRVAAAARTFTVPASDMAKLPAGIGTASFTTQTWTQFDAGLYDVRLEAEIIAGTGSATWQ